MRKIGKIGKTRGLLMLAVMALAGSAAGCAVETSTSCGPGEIQAEWVVRQNGVNVGCAPGDEVDLLVNGTAYTAACGDFFDATGAIPPGGYSVSLELFDAGNNLLSQTPTMPLDVPCNTTEDIGTVPFNI